MKKLVGFYLNYVVQQVNALGGAVVNLARSTAAELELLNEKAADTDASVAELDARLTRLERGEGGS